jgi:uncharacterized protein (DUF1015 family)
MATVEPFSGIRYNPQKISSLAEVVTPPYDVIAADQQAAYYARSPFNVIRVELGQDRPDDSSEANAHTRAHEYLQAWQSQGVLIRDPQPSFYLVSTRYRTAEEIVTRWGLIAQVGLEPFGAHGHILPHEQTFPAIKSERLGLMRASGMNTSPIFALFDDRAQLMDGLQKYAHDHKPLIEFEDDSGARHGMWRLADQGRNAKIKAAFEDRRLYIADGHHRYETCLAYRDEWARQDKHYSDRHPSNGTLMYISSMQDPGLKVLPTHRALPKVAAHLRQAFIQRAESHFDIQPIAMAPEYDGAAARQLCAALEAMPAETGLGLAIRGDERLYRLKLRPDAAKRVYTASLPSPLRRLNVTLLSEFVFPELLEMDSAKLDNAQSIHFRHDAADTVAEVHRGTYDMAFILKATPVEQVRVIAEAGLSMPRKTTYFAPKVITGLVMRALHPAG